MSAAGVALAPRSELLSLERLAQLIGWVHEAYPLTKIKLTGGEPLVRRDLDVLVTRLAELPDCPELSMTTNGSRLAHHVEALAAAGLARVNVSLDTLDPDRYRELTRGGRLDDTLTGIDAARIAGLTPIKLNAVLRRSSWLEDVPALLDFAVARGHELRFLELMRTGTERTWCEAETVHASEVLTWLDAHPDCELIHGHALSAHGAEPARRGLLQWRGAGVEVGWILPVSRPFCAACDRLRLDARGRIRRCLMDPERLELAKILDQQGEPSARAALAGFIAGKRAPEAMITGSAMAELGG
jgi:cyclic pyranopterin phosphate synthase